MFAQTSLFFRTMLFAFICSSIQASTFQSFFIDNTSVNKRADRPIENPAVHAAFYSDRGPVLFGAEGAFIRSSTSNQNKTSKTSQKNPHYVVFQLGLRHMSSYAEVDEQISGVLNILKGDKSKWQSEIQLFNGVTYKDARPKIDMSFSRQDGLSYALTCRKGFNPDDLHLETGGQSACVNEQGQLVVKSHGSTMTLGRPRAFQVIGGEAVEVEVSYRVEESGQFTFELGPFNREHELIIDPSITWGTYLGGLDSSYGYSFSAGHKIAVDSTDHTYIFGITSDSGFPISAGAYQTQKEDRVCFITKMSSAGTLLFSTFLGGSNGINLECGEIILSSSGEAIVGGTTISDDFPITTSAHDTTCQEEEGFISKLHANGSSLVFSTFVGGNGHDSINDLELLNNGDIAFAGVSLSNDLSHNGTEYDRTTDGSADGLVGVLSADGTTMRAMTYLGDSDFDWAYGLTSDSNRNLYVVGETGSSQFPTTTGTLQPIFGGNRDGFLCRLSADLTTLEYGTFIGKSEFDICEDVILSSGNNPIVIGITRSPNFPTSSGAVDTSFGGHYDGFLLSIQTAPSSALLFSTLISGTPGPFGGSTLPKSVAVNNSGEISVACTTSHTNLPTHVGAVSTTRSGEEDGYIFKVNSDATSLIIGTYLGGTSEEGCTDLALQSNGNIIATGYTTSHDFPTTAGAYDRIMNCDGESFITRLSANGNSLEYSSLLGGNGPETGYGMVLDSSDNVVIAGRMASSDFPITTGPSFGGPVGDLDVFVTKISHNDGSLMFSTIFGGTNEDSGTAVALGSGDEIFVVGTTESPDFPLAGAYNYPGSGEDFFVSKLTSTGSSFTFSQRIGGDGTDNAEDIVLSQSGNGYLIGTTGSNAFFGTPYVSHGWDNFIYKFNTSTGIKVNYRAWGGEYTEYINDAAIDINGNILIVGSTNSSDYPITNNAYQTSPEGFLSGYLTILDPNLLTAYSTFLKGSATDDIQVVALDNSNMPIVAGTTSSPNFPKATGAYGTPSVSEHSKGFVSCLNITPTGTTIGYTAFIGGSTESNWIHDIVVDSFDDVFCVGTTHSTFFPTTLDALDDSYNGGEEGFLCRLSLNGRFLSYSSFIGGAEDDSPFAVALTDQHNVIVAGNTKSAGFPMTTGAHDLTFSGHSDIFAFEYYFCAPDIIVDPAPTQACLGGDATFTVEARGNPPLAYQWLKNGQLIQGETQSNMTLSGVQLTDLDGYSCRVSNGCGTVTSQAGVLSLKDPVILTEPSNQDVCLGDPATFTVVAQGGSLTYQWELDGVTIAGANSSSYQIATVGGLHEGTYTCLIANNCDSIYSDSAELTIGDPKITAQPQDQSICTGATANFQLAVTGPVSAYQWYKDSQVLPGETNVNLVISDVESSDQGQYQCVISHSCGTTTSDPASLALGDPNITTQPISRVACTGNTVNFSVSATGSNLTYQWRFQGVNLNGETSPQLSLSSVNASDQGSYDCVVSSSGCGTTTSTSATLSISTLSITQDPQDASACVGHSGAGLSFSVTANGSQLSYQWYKDGSILSGKTLSTLNFPIDGIIQTSDLGQYHCNVSDTCGNTISSNQATLSSSNSVIVTQPQSQSICLGSDVTFQVVAEGPDLTYAWYNAADVPVPGGNSARLTLVNPTLQDIDAFFCVITNPCGINTTNDVTFTFSDPNIVVQPQSRIACGGVGENVTFSITAEGSSLSYLWKKDGVSLGETNTTLVLNNVTSANAGDYTCTVSNSCGSVVSDPAALTVDAISLTLEPQDQVACEGGTAQFSVTVNGDNLNYQWMKDGIDIVGATSNVLVINPVQASDVGNYHCNVENSCSSSVSSNSASLTLTSGLVIVSNPQSQSVCSGSSISFTVMADGDSLSYQWHKDLQPIVGATSNVLPLSSVTSNDVASYHCVVTNPCGDVASGTADLNLNNVEITRQPQAQMLCIGENWQLSVDATGPDQTYQWQKDQVDLPLETQPMLMVASAAISDSGAYRCVISNPCGHIETDEVAVVVNELMVTLDPISQAACDGDTVSFTVQTAGDGIGYEWIKDGFPLAGATSETLTIQTFSALAAGEYWCQISNSCGSTSSSSALLTDGSPSITYVSTSAQACDGEDLTLQVIAEGQEPLSYQWKKDGQNLANETGSDLQLTVLQSKDSGNYQCQVSNDCDNITSSDISLVVKETAGVTLDLQSQEACQGERVEFCVTATGTSPFTYVWYFDGLIISGQTGPCLTINPVTASSYGEYTVDVTNDCGGTMSSAFLSEPSTLQAYVTPVTKAQGLNDLMFTGSHNQCSDTGLFYEWRLPETGDQWPGNPLQLPVQDMTRFLEVYVTDTSTSISAMAVSLILVAVDQRVDFNFDGLNNHQDLYDALQYWNSGFVADLNGDGQVDILDFLYINLDDEP